jgi:hypothetical protein
MFQPAQKTPRLRDRRVVADDGILDGEDILPGFRYPLAELFKKWDWE